MSKLAVIAEFVDRKTGARVYPGDPVPDLDAETIARLKRARCLGPAVKGDTPAKPETVAKAPDSFPAGSQAVAGGDGGDTGGGRKPGKKRGKKAQQPSE